MGTAVAILGALVTLICAILLLTRYGQVRVRLLLWSGLCFVGLTVNNVLVIVDLLVLPEPQLYLSRLLCSAIAMSLLLYGLIWDSE